MNKSLDSVIENAFSAEGEMSNAMLVEKSVAHRRAAKRRISRPILVGMTVLVLAAGAVTAKAFIDRQYIFENGVPAGTVTEVKDGVYEVNITDSNKPIEQRTFETRNESGESTGSFVFGRTDTGKTSK